MKIFKVLLVICISIVLVGCKNQKFIKEDTTSTKTTIPTYTYSDEFFNRNFSKDEQGNTYFKAGNYFYQLDQQNTLKKVFHCLIDNQYLVYDAKYYEGKFYLLVLKVNHDYGNSLLGLATVDLQGNNFQYLNDLVYLEKSLPFNLVNFRISNNYIYLLDLYNDTPSVYTYSLSSNTIEDLQNIDIDNERTTFYTKTFPEYPYQRIQHIYNNTFYHIQFSTDKKLFLQYNPINKENKEYDISEYYDATDQRVGLFYIDLIDNSWFLFSSRGVFKFDADFKNRYDILDSTIFNESYNIEFIDHIITLTLVNNP